MRKLLNLFDRLQTILIDVDFQLTHLPCTCALFCWCDLASVNQHRAVRLVSIETENRPRWACTVFPALKTAPRSKLLAPTKSFAFQWEPAVRASCVPDAPQESAHTVGTQESAYAHKTSNAKDFAFVARNICNFWIRLSKVER
jgi:hypothetical protein